jgi:hypothetical protein
MGEHQLFNRGQPGRCPRGDSFYRRLVIIINQYTP